MKASSNQTEILRRIIIIDDNPDIHKDFAMILTAEADLSELEDLESELFGVEKLEERWPVGVCGHAHAAGLGRAQDHRRNLGR